MKFNRTLALQVCSAFGIAFMVLPNSAFAKSAKSKKEPISKAFVSVGEHAPDFSIKTIENKEFSLSAAKGKIIVLDFFATWCPPCREELPHLENEVWQRFKDKGIVVLLLGREHNEEELKKFQSEQKLSMEIAPDPKREVYSKFAKDMIPRTFVLDKDGKVIFESTGYVRSEFKKMVKTISHALEASE